MQTIIKDLGVVRLLCMYTYLPSYNRGTDFFLLYCLILIHLGISNSFPFFRLFIFLNILIASTLDYSILLDKIGLCCPISFSFSLDEFQLSPVPFVLSFAGFLLQDQILIMPP